jgi:hypothetical protein
MENHRILSIFAFAIIFVLAPVTCEKTQNIQFRSHSPYKWHFYDEEKNVNEVDKEFMRKFAESASRHMSDKQQEMELIDEEAPAEIPSKIQVRSADSDSDCVEGEKCKKPDQGYDFMDFSLSKIRSKDQGIALKAAQEAQAANKAQDSAGKEASKQAKFLLAEKAIQAAKAAQAALSAKQAILDELEREVREAEMVVQDLSSSIQQSEANSNAALKAYQQTMTLLKMLTELVQNAQSTVAFAEQAAQGSQQELNEKTQLLEAAKNRVEKLLREVKAARSDFASTKKEAYRASMFAKEAKQNA